MLETYLDGEFDVVAQVDVVSLADFREVEEDLPDDVGPLDEAELALLLDRVDDALVLDGLGRVFEPDGARDERAAACHRRHLEADAIAGCQRHVAFDVDHGEGEEEALAAVLVADPALSLLAGLRVDLDLGGDGADDAFLAHDLKPEDTGLRLLLD